MPNYPNQVLRGKISVGKIIEKVDITETDEYPEDLALSQEILNKGGLEDEPIKD
ncbi:hypothetical protein [uncultured Eubacterium sp.]|uniref:hypothetical protein n=1 Tax=uncultured Eubacterium sp. TaxID=165185 RepID=UPI002592BBD4|nr:hypothetical protein [uncultured Eubacterium sp.]